MDHLLLGGMSFGALAVAAIVEGKDVDAEGVEGGQRGNGVGEGAVAVWKEEDGRVNVVGVRRSGDPPASELGNGGFVGAEVDQLEGSAVNGGGSGRGSSGMKDKLPLALIEEQAEREITAEDGDDYGAEDSFDEPDGIDWFWFGSWLRLALGRFCGGTGHEGVCMNFSIR